MHEEIHSPVYSCSRTRARQQTRDWHMEASPQGDSAPEHKEASREVASREVAREASREVVRRAHLVEVNIAASVD